MDSRSIFEESIVVSKSPFAVPGIPGLLVAPLTPVAPDRHAIIASSLFVFPGRAKENPNKYQMLLADYVAGLERSLRNMQYFPTWEYRLYVDHSVYSSYPDNRAAESAAKFVRQQLDAICKDHPKLQLFGVRYVRKGYTPGTTFLPSIWRYLPIIDPEVDMFYCTDMDNPPPTLAFYLGSKWMSDPKHAQSRLLFILSEGYVPLQCGSYYAQHIESANASNGLCPIAQFWFGKRPAGSSTAGGSIMPSSMVSDMLEMAFDPATNEFFHTLDMPFLLSAGRAVIESNVYHDIAMRHTKLSAVLSTLRKELMHIISLKNAGRAAQLTKGRLADVATLMLLGRIVADSAATDGGRHALQTAAYALHSDESNKTSAAEKVMAHQGYGIDEYVLHVAMHETHVADICLSTTPEAGIHSYPYVKVSSYSTHPFLKWLSDIVETRSTGWQSWVVTAIVEYAARAAVFLQFIGTAQLSARYASRLLLLCGGSALPHGIASKIQSGFKNLLSNKEFYQSAVRRVMYIPNPKATNAYLKSFDAHFDPVTYRLGCGSDRGFEFIKELGVRTVMLTMMNLHLEKLSLDPSSASVPW